MVETCTTVTTLNVLTLLRKCVCALEKRAFYYIKKITQMSPIDGPILLVSEINLSQTYSENISEFQPSKANGLGGVALMILIYII